MHEAIEAQINAQNRECERKVIEEITKHQGIEITPKMGWFIRVQAGFLDERFMTLAWDKQLNKTNVLKAIDEAEALYYVYGYLFSRHPDLVTNESYKIMKQHSIVLHEKFKKLSQKNLLNEKNIIKAFESYKQTSNAVLIGFFAGTIASGTTLALSETAQTFVMNLLAFMPHALAIGCAIAVCAIAGALLAILVQNLMNDFEHSKTTASK